MDGLVIIWSALSGDAKVGGVGVEAVTTAYTNETFSSKEHGWFFNLLLLQYFLKVLCIQMGLALIVITL
jgi:hypothetical protein